MPPKLRTGSILIEPTDLRNYLLICFGTTFLFFLVYRVTDFLLGKMEGEDYLKADNDLRVWKNSNFTTIFHHIFNIGLLNYTMYFSCASMDGSPSPSAEGGTFTSREGAQRWGWFRSETCYS